VISRPRLYAIQSQPRPRLISGDWFQEPRQHRILWATPHLIQSQLRPRPLSGDWFQEPHPL